MLQFLKIWLLSLCFFIVKLPSTSAQLLLEKEPLYNNTVVFDPYQYSLLESQITQQLIQQHKVKSITESFEIVNSAGVDTVLPIQTNQYDTSGNIIHQIIYYYGLVYVRTYFYYEANKISVFTERFENDFKRILSYELLLDSLNNPIKYIVYEAQHNRDGLDSILFSYQYSTEGYLISRQQSMYYESDTPINLLFEFTYNPKGQLKSYDVLEADRLVYTAQYTYEKDKMVTKNAVYSNTGERISIDVTKTKFTNIQNYFDNTTYLYDEQQRLLGIKRQYIHDPLRLRSAPDDKTIILMYDTKGLLQEKYDAQDRRANHVLYTWTFWP